MLVFSQTSIYLLKLRLHFPGNAAFPSLIYIPPTNSNVLTMPSSSNLPMTAKFSRCKCRRNEEDNAEKKFLVVRGIFYALGVFFGFLAGGVVASAVIWFGFGTSPAISFVVGYAAGAAAIVISWFAIAATQNEINSSNSNIRDKVGRSREVEYRNAAEGIFAFLCGWILRFLSGGLFATVVIWLGFGASAGIGFGVGYAAGGPAIILAFVKMSTIKSHKLTK
jgi:hypothetical protein